MDTSGIGSALVRLLSQAGMQDLLGELLVPGRVLEADVVSVFEDRAMLSLGRGIRLEVALQAPVEEGQRLQLQVQPRPSAPAQGGRPRPVALKLLGTIQRQDGPPVNARKAVASGKPSGVPGAAPPSGEAEPPAQVADRAGGRPPGQTASVRPQLPPPEAAKLAAAGRAESPAGAGLRGGASQPGLPEAAAPTASGAPADAATAAPGVPAQVPAPVAALVPEARAPVAAPVPEAPAPPASTPGKAPAPAPAGRTPAGAAPAPGTGFVPEAPVPPAPAGATAPTPDEAPAPAAQTPHGALSPVDRPAPEPAQPPAAVAAREPAVPVPPAPAPAALAGREPAAPEPPAPAPAGPSAITARELAAPSGPAPSGLAPAAPQPAGAHPTPAVLPQILWLPIPLPDGNQAWAQLYVTDDPEREGRGQAPGPAHQVRLWWETPGLGAVQVVLDARDRNLTAVFTSLAPDTRQAVERSLPDLQRRLSDAGFPDARLGSRQPAPGEAVGPVVPGEGSGLLDKRL